MLSDTDKEDGDVGSVDDADQGADHVSHCVALGDDEAVKGAAGTKCCIEVPRLGDGICAHQGLSERDN